MMSTDTDLRQDYIRDVVIKAITYGTQKGIPEPALREIINDAAKLVETGGLKFETPILIQYIESRWHDSIPAEVS